MKNNISATYNITLYWDLEEHDIDCKQIEEYFVKYGVLNIKFKDSEEWVSIEPDDDPREFDFKYAHLIEEF